MGERDKFCVLAFDNSGSIGDSKVSKIYWKNLKKVYEELLPKYNGKVYIIEWNSSARHINEQKFLNIVDTKHYTGGTEPSAIWPTVQSIIDKEALPSVSYDVVITTDGEVPNNTSYIRNLNQMRNKPDKSFIYFWGYAHSMTMNFLDGLPPPVEFFTMSIDKNNKIFEHKGTKTDTTQFYNDIIELPEYKLLQTGPIEQALDKENLSRLYITLYRKCAVYSQDEITTGDAGKVLKKYVDGINAMVHGHIFEKLDFDQEKFDEAFKNWRTNQKYIVDTFITSLESVTSSFSGQSIITKINNLANGNIKIDRKLNTYGKDTYKKMKKQLAKTCETTTTTYKTDESEKALTYATLSQQHGYFVGSLLCSMKLSIEFLEQKYQGLHLTIKDRLLNRYKKENNNENPNQDQMNMLEGIHYVQCPILLLDDKEYSSYVVLWIGEDDETFDVSGAKTSLLEGPHGNLLKFDRKKPINVRRRLAKNPSHLFEVLSVEHLNRRIPPNNQQISVDAFLGLESTTVVQLGHRKYKKVFKSPLHSTDCYGLILYNSSTSEKFDLDGPMSDSEFSVLIHNCSTLTWLLFGDGFFVGSYSLLYIFFLWILYHSGKLQTKRNQNKQNHFDQLTKLITDKVSAVPEQRSYIQECVNFTIKRTVRMLKCNFMLFSGLEPTLTVPMMNAFIFHIKVFPESKEMIKENLEKIAYDTFNSLRKTGYNAIQIANLAEDVLDLKFHDKYQLKLWLWWNYMCKCELPTKWKFIHFKQISISKTQKWAPVDGKNVKLMLIEGKNTDKPFLSFLDDVKIEDIDRLLQLYYECRKAPKYLQDLDKIPTGKFIRPKVIERIPPISCIGQIKSLCGETGALPVICPVTQLPSKECHEKQRLDFSAFGYKKKAIFGHSYFQACREWILLNPKDIPNKPKEKLIQIPILLKTFLEYVVERTPLCVYPKPEELNKELSEALRMYRDWANNLSATQNSINYWKKIWVNDNKMQVN